MELSMMGYGEPILKDNREYSCVHHLQRMPKQKLIKLNRKEELNTIAVQKKLLELERGR